MGLNYKDRITIAKIRNDMQKLIGNFSSMSRAYYKAAYEAKEAGDDEMFRQASDMYLSIEGQRRRLNVMLMQINFAIGQCQFSENNRFFVKAMKKIGKGLSMCADAFNEKGAKDKMEKGMNAMGKGMEKIDILTGANAHAIENISEDFTTPAERKFFDDAIGPVTRTTDVGSATGSVATDNTTQKKPLEPEHVAIPVAANEANAPVPDVLNGKKPRYEGNDRPAFELGSGNFNNKSGYTVEGLARRPKRLSDFKGQDKAVSMLSAPIITSKLQGKALPHVLLCGSYGHGKTTLAKIIANEMGTSFIEVTPSIKSKDMIYTLKKLERGQIVFVDEIHKLSPEIIESILYPAMEDYQLRYVEKTGMKTENKTIKIQPFTLIGATTESGLLLKPFYSKFPIKITLEEYKLDTIASIVANSFVALGLEADRDAIYEVAKRSRMIPRIANAYVDGISNNVIAKEAKKRNIFEKGALSGTDAIKSLNLVVNKNDALEYFTQIGVDNFGLTNEDRELLSVLVHKFNGGPIGQESLAKALNMSNNRVDQEYEPYLVKLGFINVTSQGRCATDKAFEYFGIEKKRNTGARPGKQTESGKAGRPPENVDSVKVTSDDVKPDAPVVTPAATVVAPSVEGRNELIDGAGSSEARAEESVGTKSGEGRVSVPIDENDDDIAELHCERGTFDKKYADRFEEMFSGFSKPDREDLDTIFEGADKSYDSTAKNKSVLVLDNGRKVYCDSKLERRFLAYMFKKGYITDAKSEFAELEYDSSACSGKKYYPDFAVRLYDGRIAIVEMKNLAAMGYHLNVDKYECLADFCTAQGFMYAEICKDYGDKRYYSAEQIKRDFFDKDLESFVCAKAEENGVCTKKDLEGFARYDVKKLVALLLRNRKFKNVDRTGQNPIITIDE